MKRQELEIGMMLHWDDPKAGKTHVGRLESVDAQRWQCTLTSELDGCQHQVHPNDLRVGKCFMDQSAWKAVRYAKWHLAIYDKLDHVVVARRSESGARSIWYVVMLATEVQPADQVVYSTDKGPEKATVVGKWGHGAKVHKIRVQFIWVPKAYGTGLERCILEADVACTGQTSRGGISGPPPVTGLWWDASLDLVTCNKCKALTR